MLQHFLQQTTNIATERLAAHNYVRWSPHISIPVVLAADAYKMAESLERFWMQQTDSNMTFINALQKMKDIISMERTKQMVQNKIDSFF